MKFIFPKNYNFKNKILGIIDYPTAFVNVIWYAFILILVNILFTNIKIKIFIFISVCFPLFLFSISGFHGENIVYVFIYIIKFIFRQKLYFYDKNYKKFL